MGKRKEESVSKPRSHKRQRQEFTDEHSDGLNDEENLLFSFDSNLSSVSVSCFKKIPKLRKLMYKILYLWLMLK